ncbi:MAG: PorP/SprF family type IX secretion system membrane protein [Cytophagales bacterium]|nr:PorP/SprF family type IX secretion system membrane protein [Cytophagales bacterium]
MGLLAGIKKRISLLGLLLMQCLALSAQQEAYFAQSATTPVLINPAFSGQTQETLWLTSHKSQWSDVEGEPVTALSVFSTYFPSYNLGLGVQAAYDQAGPVKTVDFGWLSAYHLRISDSWRFSLGMKWFFRQHRINIVGLRVYSSSLDHLLKTNPRSLWRMNIALGAAAYNESFYVGFSVPRVLEQRQVLYDLENQVVRFDNLHFYFHTGGLLTVNAAWQVLPSAVVRLAQATAPAIDFGASLIFRKTFWFGFLYRNQPAVAFPLQFAFNEHIRVMYTFEKALNRIPVYHKGSHELSFRMDVVFKKRRNVNMNYFKPF